MNLINVMWIFICFDDQIVARGCRLLSTKCLLYAYLTKVMKLGTSLHLQSFGQVSHIPVERVSHHCSRANPPETRL